MSDVVRYRLVTELARGGMGIVHLAVPCERGAQKEVFVVKELLPEMANDSAFVSMFLDEARLATRLRHPNIVRTNQASSIGQRHFFVMECLEGGPLREIIRRSLRRGSFPLGAHLRVISDVLLGLHYAHTLTDFDGRPLGIVHRDVSPHNVFVTFEGQTKLLDFGIAKASDSSLRTKTGVLKGRVAYMAPEQALGEKVDCRADVYSVGVMIWEAVASRRIWTGKTDMEILSQLHRSNPPRLRSVLPTAPEALDEICARATSRLPAERYPTAAALRDDLEKYLASQPDVPTTQQIGAMVAEAFEEERARMAAMIDRALSGERVGGRAAAPTVPDRAPTARDDRSAPVLGDDLSSSSSRRDTPTDAPHVIDPSGEMASEAASGHVPWFRRGRAAVAAASATLLVLLVATGASRGGRTTTAGASTATDPPEMRVTQVSAPPLLSVPPALLTPLVSSLDAEALAAAPHGTPVPVARTPGAGNPVHGASPKSDAARARTKRKSRPSASASPASNTTGASAAALPDVGPAGGRLPQRPIDASNPYESQ
jgi:serine/threonine protein kinase